MQFLTIKQHIGFIEHFPSNLSDLMMPALRIWDSNMEIRVEINPLIQVYLNVDNAMFGS